MKADDRTNDAREDSGQPARSNLDWPRATGRVSDFMATIAVRKRRQRQRRFQAAAALVAIIGIVEITWRRSVPPPPEMPAAGIAMASARAILAVPVRQVLADGSVVEMRDNAEIAVAFTEGIRRVVLRRGEAHFEIAKNPNRPFVVDAGGIEIRAVGTKFAVQHRARAIEVYVTEGQVAVEERSATLGSATERNRASSANAADTLVFAPADTAAPRGTGLRMLAMLEAGKGVVVDITADTPEKVRAASARVFAVSTSEMDQRLAWRAPRLDLSSTPLAQAIAMINRHSTIQLVLGDEELGEVELSGVLRADNVEPLLRVLEHNYAINAERSGDKIILRKSR